MTVWRLFANGGRTVQNGSTEYAPLLGGSGSLASVTEADAQAKAYTAYTFSDMRSQHVINGPACTLHLNDDGANISALDVSMTGSGWAETIGSGSVLADSLVNYEFDSLAQMHGDFMSPETQLVTYEHASIDAPLFGGGGIGASATRYMGFGTAASVNADEVEVEVGFKRSQSLNNLRITNTGADSLTSTFSLRKDGVTSSAVIVTVNGTGTVEDTTGSESYADGEDGEFIWDIAAGSGTTFIYQCQMNTPETWIASNRENQISTSGSYANPSGDSVNASVDDNYSWRGGSSTAGNLTLYVTTAGSGTRTISVRVASTNSTALSVSITGTGRFEDTEGSESVGDTDHIGWFGISGTTAYVMDRLSLELPWSGPGGAPARRVFITSS